MDVGQTLLSARMLWFLTLHLFNPQKLWAVTLMTEGTKNVPNTPDPLSVLRRRQWEDLVRDSDLSLVVPRSEKGLLNQYVTYRQDSQGLS